MKILLFFLVLLCQGSKFQKKEETCLVLASRSIKEREKEITQFLSKHPSFDKKDLSDKLTEDSYDFCMSLITIKEISSLGGIATRPYSTYSHLVSVPLEKTYKTAKDLKVSSTFSEYRVEVSKRIAMSSISLDKEL